MIDDLIFHGFNKICCVETCTENYNHVCLFSSFSSPLDRYPTSLYYLFDWLNLYKHWYGLGEPAQRHGYANIQLSSVSLYILHHPLGSVFSSSPSLPPCVLGVALQNLNAQWIKHYSTAAIDVPTFRIHYFIIKIYICAYLVEVLLFKRMDRIDKKH